MALVIILVIVVVIALRGAVGAVAVVVRGEAVAAVVTSAAVVGRHAVIEASDRGSGKDDGLTRCMLEQGDVLSLLW